MPSTDPARPARARPASPGHEARAKTAVILVIAAVLLAAGAWWVHKRWTHIYVDDARVDGEVITISSRVSGYITDLPAGEGDAVSKGQLLVAIDDREARAQRAILEARLASLGSQTAVLGAQRGQVDDETSGRLHSETNRLAAAEAELAARDVMLRQTQADLKRSQELAQQKWISEQALERARLSTQQAEQNHKRAAADVAAARGALSSAGGSRKQLQVMEQQQKVLGRQAEELRAELRRQELDLADRQIVAPAAGKVVMTFVRKGELVNAGQRILMFHDPAQIWIEANVKETDVGKLRAGMPVEVHVDAYRDRTFAGHIHRIGQAATSKFALLPDPNPSGNFTKVTQRLPVRIVLDDKDARLRPGMMVEVSIDVRDAGSGAAAQPAASPSASPATTPPVNGPRNH